MPVKCAWWHLFYQIKGSFYLNNHTYLNAWCRGCVKRYIELQQEADVVKVAMGELQELEVRSEETLMQLALIGAPDPKLTAPSTGVTPVSGRWKPMSTHALGCPYIKPAVLKLVQDKADADSATAAHLKSRASNRHTTIPIRTSIEPMPDSPQPNRDTSSLAMVRPLKRAKTSHNVLDDAPPWSDELQQLYSRDMCRLFVSCGMSWNMADDIEMHLFMGKWIPGSIVPGRRSLSGVFLDRAVAEAELKTRLRVNGKMGTGQCDGWKNCAKIPVVSSMMSVERKADLLRTHDMAGEPKTGDRLLEVIRDDIVYAKDHFGVETIGWCTDDGPDGKKARRLLKELMPYIITLVCWAHQINLVVGEYLMLPGFLDTINHAVEVVKWFNNHGTALAWFREEQVLTYKGRSRPLALLLPAATRWTAHFHSITRLLELSEAMQTCCLRHREGLLVCAGKTADVRAKAQQILDIVRDDFFWKKLLEIKAHLEPLAIAANVTQAPHTRADHVLLSLANLYRIYSTSTIDSAVQQKIHDSLERRWKAADQDIFILAVFFNPYLRASCFSRAALTQGALNHIAKKVFKQLFQSDPNSDFVRGLLEYANRKAEFSDEAMMLEDSKLMAAEESKDIDIVLIWQTIDASDDAVCPGRNGVTKL
ncbi:hypothetical protein BV25DRAFT_948780 [Artomyces pyxidatus]|uniref:Uncharacterized protein n=1 Tax=Artomyces pyxidatus TaxID=48021 RepID=A0ACB8SV05_9AGAM|nr:hypothetical protein BV25DRAFT_948780 [Artomyces pyxidatus]